MSIQPAWQHTLDFFGTPLVVEPSAGLLTSDAGLLPFRQLDEQLGLTREGFRAVTTIFRVRVEAADGPHLTRRRAPRPG